MVHGSVSGGILGTGNNQPNISRNKNTFRKGKLGTTALNRFNPMGLKDGRSVYLQEFLKIWGGNEKLYIIKQVFLP